MASPSIDERQESGISTRKAVDLLLVGKSGNGKTATLKSIMMQGEFETQGGWNTVTNTHQWGENNFHGRIIRAVDTPGLFSTYTTREEEHAEFVRDSIMKTFKQFPDGFHALVLVLSYGRRYNQEDIQTVKILKEVLGDDWLKRYGVVLVTSGDNFRRDCEQTGDTFEKWCANQTGNLGNVLRECNFRCVLFDNVSKEKSLAENQIAALISKIDEIRTKHWRYTSKYLTLALNNEVNSSFPWVIFEAVTNFIAIYVLRQISPHILTTRQRQGTSQPAGRSTDLLLVGKSGNGLSATCKSIVTSSMAESKGGFNSISKALEFGDGQFEGHEIRVAVTNGVYHTDHKDQDDIVKRQVQLSIREAFRKAPEGFHAIILVLSYGRRFGDRDKNAIEILKSILGKNVLKDHCILVMTYGDSFSRDFEGCNTRIEDWFNEQTGYIKYLFEECRSRCVLFNNVTQDGKKRADQLHQLMMRVNGIQIRYTSEMFASNFNVDMVDEKGGRVDTKTLLEMRSQILNFCISAKRDIKIAQNAPEEKLKELFSFLNFKINSLLRDMMTHTKEFLYVRNAATSLQTFAVEELSLAFNKELKEDYEVVITENSREDKINKIIDQFEKEMDNVIPRWQRIEYQLL